MEGLVFLCIIQFILLFILNRENTYLTNWIRFYENKVKFVEKLEEEDKKCRKYINEILYPSLSKEKIQKLTNKILNKHG